jgi:hypothetical protein
MINSLQIILNDLSFNTVSEIKFNEILVYLCDRNAQIGTDVSIINVRWENQEFDFLLSWWRNESNIIK